MIKLSLRRTTSADAAFAKALKYEGLGPYIRATWGWDGALQEKFFIEDFDMNFYHIIVLNDEDVGTIKIVPHDDALEIHNLCVVSNRRKQGIGEAILKQVEQQAFSAGKAVRLDVLKVNPAQALYKRLGYRMYREDEHHFHLSKQP